MPEFLDTLIESARTEAIRLKHPYIRSEHLLLALLKHDETLMSVSSERLFAFLETRPAPACGAEQKLILAKGAQRALQKAQEIGLSKQVVMSCILQSSPMLRGILHEMGVPDHATSD